jgi:flagellar M-ring protein FliF
VGANGAETWEARPEAELEALRALVESAIGFDEGRGDVISIQSMEFAQASGLGGEASASAGGFFAANAMTLIQLAVLSLVVMALGMFVLRPMMQAEPPSAVAGELTGPDGLSLGPASMGSVERSIETAGELIDADGVGVDQLTALRDAVQERPDDSAFLLRSWLESDDKAGKAA